MSCDFQSFKKYNYYSIQDEVHSCPLWGEKKIDVRIGVTYKTGHFYLSDLVSIICNKLWGSPHYNVAGIWKVISQLIILVVSGQCPGRFLGIIG